MTADGIRVERELFDGDAATELRGALAAELRAIYGRDTEPGSKPTAADTPVFLVARDADGKALGCGALRPLADDTVEIKRMYVRPDARGRGLGRLILEALEREAEGLGARRIVLETGTSQHEARALYERHGYRRIPCFGAYVDGPVSICFERRLA